MPTNTADQGLQIPIGADAANAPAFMATFAGQVEDRLIKQYVDETDRTTRNAAPGQGEVSWLQNLKRLEFWNSVAGAWWEMLPIQARKTAEIQTANATTAFLSDTHLVMPMRANAVYELEGWFWWDSGTTGDIKWQFIGPAGFLVPAWTVLGGNATTATSVDNGVSTAATTAIARAGLGIGTFNSGQLEGIVTTAGTAGNLQLQWTQNASEAVNTRMKTHSWMRLTRIG